MGSRQHSALAAGDILLHISRLRIFYINYDICAHHAAPAWQWCNMILVLEVQ